MVAPAYNVVYIVTMENNEYEIPEMDLPGMWSLSDFMGGDPDERSYAERGWPAHAFWGHDPSGHCNCKDCNAEDGQ